MESKSWWQKLKHNPIARTGAIVLIIFYIAVIFGDIVAPYEPTASQQSGSLLPPTQIYWRTQQNGQMIGPHVYPTIQGPINRQTGEQALEVDFSRPTPLRLFVKGEDYQLFKLSFPFITQFSFDEPIELNEVTLFNGIPGNLHLFGTTGENSPTQFSPTAVVAGDETPEAVELVPAYFNLLGTDNSARDVFSRLVYGGRISLSIGLVGIAISFPLGMLVGGISGYFGGAVDAILMRIVEVIMTIPSIYLLVSLSVILPQGLSSSERFLLIVIIISFITWAGLARVIRGEVLSLKERTFVQASQSMGGRSLHIIIRHILPQTATYIIISATLAVPGYIISEAVLSLIGLGIQEPDPSWGNMLTAGNNAAILVLNPWLIWPPAALIVITVLSFNVLGDGLRDALDPRSLQER
ncbi:MAG: ABC transporter substrate-binding protein [Leptolyngbya foveolarum]|uniref:ABC transporter substrate-binding protein n=1 Tax=Leptolyngbya foveolarum TaxID=47253 RepID=A0A2W4UER0_9CYAN|nr:MAG: ABC transporter substrate-binding protein [Leptolyngbya foveolarum]